jgi:hypothetical protein
MAETLETMDRVARRVRAALGAEDPAAFADLLDPAVRWGAPGARNPTCTSRDQVVAWYRRGVASGVRGEIAGVEIVGDRLLVHMTVRNSNAADERGGAALRWQVLTVRAGRIVDIAGFDDRVDAEEFCRASAEPSPAGPPVP